MIVCPAEIEWIAETPTKKTKRLWFDAAANRIVQLTRFEPGATMALHRHLGDELIYVIEGDVFDESGTITPGNMSYRPDGCVHSANSRNGATSFVIMTGEIEAADTIRGQPHSIGFVLSNLAWKEEGHGISQKLVWPRSAPMPRAALQRLAPGTSIPQHRHLSEEFIFVLEGSYFDGADEVHCGQFNYLPKGHVREVASRHGATVLSVAFGGIEQVA